jgi:hypothetical protein
MADLKEKFETVRAAVQAIDDDPRQDPAWDALFVIEAEVERLRGDVDAWKRAAHDVEDVLDEVRGRAEDEAADLRKMLGVSDLERIALRERLERARQALRDTRHGPPGDCIVCDVLSALSDPAPYRDGSDRHCATCQCVTAPEPQGEPPAFFCPHCDEKFSVRVYSVAAILDHAHRCAAAAALECNDIIARARAETWEAAAQVVEGMVSNGYVREQVADALRARAKESK